MLFRIEGVSGRGTWMGVKVYDGDREERKMRILGCDRKRVDSVKNSCKESLYVGLDEFRRKKKVKEFEN